MRFAFNFRRAPAPIGIPGWLPTESAPKLRRGPSLALMASAGIHTLALLAAALLVTVHHLPVTQMRIVNVDLVSNTPQPPPPAAAPAGAKAAAAPLILSGHGPAIVATGGGTTIATQFFSSGIIDDPKNKDIKQFLTKLAPEERINQLCKIEGLEQLRLGMAGKVPDSLEPSAMTDSTITGTVLDAPGGAYRLGRKWYRVAFSCRATADGQGVDQFRFKLGAAIPPDQWDSHNLIAEDIEDD